jgi:cell division protein FtsI (penicillin-binding protein 3)
MAPRRPKSRATRGSTRVRSAPSVGARKRGPAGPGSRARRRLGVVTVVFLAAFGALGARLVTLQIVESRAYARLAAEQRERVIPFPARRGTIFDRRGEALAISVDLQTVYADPLHVENSVSEAAQLAPVLDRDPEDLARALQGAVPGDRFEFLARQVTPEVAEAVEDLDLPGVYLQDEAKRYYPGGRLASHVLGFVDIDGNGIAGIESQYDPILRGRPGEMKLEQDPAGRPLPQADLVYRDPSPGRSLLLTIDKDIQFFVELTLARAVQTYAADAATAIVMRPSTGEILALANVPDFDPNEAGEFDLDAQRNRAVTDVYEPGSSYKIVTASAALQEDVVTPKSAFDVPDTFAYSDREFHDSHPHPAARMTVAEIIEQSSNVGTIKIGLQLGGRLLDQYVRRFGFGSATGLDFPGESPGIVVARKDWTGPTIATIPIGQGIAVTAIQMASAYATLANDGTWVEPKLLLATMDEAGDLERSPTPATRQIVSRHTANQMERILRRVVATGTGIEAQIPGYDVAGKTGTAQKPLPTGGYGSSYVASFGGFAPALKPAIVVLVVFDEPSPIWGGATAAPTFKTITEFALRHLGVRPTGNAARAAHTIEASVADEPTAHD